jgi:hypothetical protein
MLAKTTLLFMRRVKYIYIYVTRNISTVHYYKTRTFKQAVADWISKPTIAEQSTKRRI